jgi:hypothetical protein
LCLALVLVSVLAPVRVALADTLRTINVDAVDDDEAALGCTLRDAIDLATSTARRAPIPTSARSRR